MISDRGATSGLNREVAAGQLDRIVVVLGEGGLPPGGEVQRLAGQTGARARAPPARVLSGTRAASVDGPHSPGAEQLRYDKFRLLRPGYRPSRRYGRHQQTGTIVEEMTARLDLPVGPDALAAARQIVRSVLIAWGLKDSEDVEDAVLVADELVSNAVRHGGGCLSLEVRARDQDVVVCAVDGSAVVPRRRDPDGDGGRGLGIIEALAEEWGVQDLPGGGKRVWVRIARPGLRESAGCSTANPHFPSAEHRAVAPTGA